MPRKPSEIRVDFQIPGGDEPIHDRLALGIENAIDEGRFRPGDRLPTHRDISKTFGVAIGTVTRAIESLTRRGVVKGEIGRGTFVLPQEERMADVPVDMAVNVPPAHLPPGQMGEFIAEVCERWSREPRQAYTDPAGLLEHRSSLTRWLSAHGTFAEPSEILLTVGAQHAIALSFADLPQTVTAVAAEPATFPGAIYAARDTSLRLLPVDVDEHGVVPEALDEVFRNKKAGAFFTVPTAQNPMGFETPLSRREQIAEVCRTHRAPIIEDDVYNIYMDRENKSYREIDPNNVYYSTSLSKTVTPIVRVGILIPPKARRQSLLEAMRASLWSPPLLDAAVCAEFVDSGLAQTLAARMREESRARNKMVAEELGMPHLASIRGPHVWLPMNLWRAEMFARRAMEVGVRLSPPSAQLLDPTRLAGVRLCTVAPEGRGQLLSALRRLRGLIDAPEEVVI